MSKFVFGPVPSRRLGYSLGIDIIPRKYCTFDCIYCQVGQTTNRTTLRQSFFDPSEIVQSIIQEIPGRRYIDFITFSGSGEPTLNIDIGWIIKKVKTNVSVPISVITNGSLLYRQDVRNDLLNADVVLPSFDAASAEVFEIINRPDPDIRIDMMIDGLKRFRYEFKGKVWLEVMLIKDVNNTEEELRGIKNIVTLIGPDKIHLNTIKRPPSKMIGSRVEQNELERICKDFGASSEIICDFEKRQQSAGKSDFENYILEVLKRRSLDIRDILKITGMPADEARARLTLMEKQDKLKTFIFEDTIFYTSKE